MEVETFLVWASCWRRGTPSIETTEFRWVTEPEAVSMEFCRTHIRKVLEAFRLYRMPGALLAFH